MSTLTGATTTQAAAEPDPANLDEGLATDIGFGRAIVIGSAIGILVMVAIVALAVHLAAPDIPAGAVAGIAAWTGVWAGLFLGGTITVGRWAGQNH
jgi:hypothetical protein